MLGHWNKIAHSSALVVALAQRDTGLWSYPTTDQERREVYAAEGTEEERDRLGGPFGFESLTATWNALEGLSALLSHRAVDIFDRALRSVDLCRDGGAYGSRPVSYEGRQIHASTRHTALAVLCLLQFRRTTELIERRDELQGTISWLLKQQLRTGGWPFAPTKSEEPMSTAASIACLACYLSHQAKRPSSKLSESKVKTAIRDGLTFLQDTQGASAWWASRYPHTEVTDNCFVLDMLNIALERSKLSEIRGASAFVSKVRERLIGSGASGGWPEQFGATTPALAPTISALAVLEPHYRSTSAIAQASDFVVGGLFEGGGTQYLKSWDWLMLGRVAARKEKSLPERTSRDIVSTVSRLRQEAREGALTRSSLGCIPPAALSPSLYILTGGDAEAYRRILAHHSIGKMATIKVNRKDLKRTRSTTRKGGEIGKTVFLGHGRSALWRELKDFIQDRLKLRWDEFNRIPTAGVSNVERLSKMLDSSGIAFLVLTAEDERSDGTQQARMNVIHETGLFQGRLGFNRAIVLLEEGCEEFSNIHGLGQIRFPKGNIVDCFEKIRQLLEREGFIFPR